MSLWGVSGAIRQANSRFFSCARTLIDLTVSFITLRRSKLVESSSNLPASIFEKSRMSLMIRSSDSDDILTIWRYSFCSSVNVAIEHQFRHADNGVHRRSNFMRHIG